MDILSSGILKLRTNFEFRVPPKYRVSKMSLEAQVRGTTFRDRGYISTTNTGRINPIITVVLYSGLKKQHTLWI